MADPDKPDFSHLDGRERAQAEQLLRMPGRHVLDQELPTALAEAEQSGKPFSLLVLDIFQLIVINDKHGHPAGDRVLGRTAEVLVNTFASTGKVFRVDGDEFWVTLPGISTDRAEALVSEAAQAVVAANPEYTVKVSHASATATVGESEHALRAGLAESLRRIAVESRQAWLRDQGAHGLADQLNHLR